jgi:hypothetical protein
MWARPLIAVFVPSAVAYLVWSTLWGVRAAWTWWRGVFANSSFFAFGSSMLWLFLAVSFFTLPFFFGYLYGVLGGGIYEYRKAKALTQQFT